MKSIGLSGFLWVMLFMSTVVDANPLKYTSVETSKTYEISSTSSRDDVFKLIKDLKENYAIDSKLTDYKRYAGKLTQLGIAFTDSNGKNTNLQIAADRGIPKVCIVVNQQTKVLDYVGSCEKQNQSRYQRSPELEERRQQLLYKKLERLKAKKLKEQQMLEQEQERALENRKEKLQADQSESKARLEAQLLEKRAALEAKKAQLEERRSQMLSSRDSIIAARKTAMEEKRAAAMARIQKSKEEKAKQAKQQKETKLTKKIKEEKPKLVSNQAVNFIEAIDKENTIEVTESVRKAQSGITEADGSTNKGVIYFSGEQCSYKVYENRTFIYDQQSNTVLTVNAPLGDDPARGKVILKGVTYDFEYDGLSLSVKNRDGMLINKDGNLLNPLASFDRDEITEDFQLYKEFTISRTSKAAHIRDVIKALQDLDHKFVITENVSNPKGYIYYFAFKLNGQLYSFKENEGIPVILIQLDEVNKVTRVLTAD